MKGNFQKIFLIVASILLFSGCYPEWKLAKTYIESDPDISIIIFPTNFVFKKNLKIDELSNPGNLTEFEKDSALMDKSIFLKDISDSIFLETFINSMITEFEYLGIKVYTEEYLDSFLFIKSPAYIFNIAQIELEEHYTEHEDEQDFGDYVYYKSIDLNALSYNFWFELSELNDVSEDTKLLFVSETINDVVYGYFTENIFTGNVKYKYNISELDKDIIYRYCKQFGQRYSNYTFDLLMNNYITENFPANKKQRYYMTYKKKNNSLDPTLNDRFTLMNKR